MTYYIYIYMHLDLWNSVFLADHVTKDVIKANDLPM